MEKSQNIGTKSAFMPKNNGKKLWGSKTWAHEVGSRTTFHQQYARGEEIIENRCD